MEQGKEATDRWSDRLWLDSWSDWLLWLFFGCLLNGRFIFRDHGGWLIVDYGVLGALALVPVHDAMIWLLRGRSSQR